MILWGVDRRGTRISDAKAMAKVAERLGTDGPSIILDEVPGSAWQQSHSVASIAGARVMRLAGVGRALCEYVVLGFYRIKNVSESA